MNVYGMGVNVYGQYDICNREKVIYEFTAIKTSPEEKILFFEPSFAYNVIVTNQRIYLRGFVHGRSHQNVPYDCDTSKIKQIACNRDKVLILYDSSDIDVIDIAPFTSKRIPFFISTEYQNDDDNSIIKIACGLTMSLAVDKKGNLFSIPSKLVTDASIVDIVCGREHGMYLTKTGEVYTWGAGTRGQLGHGVLEDEIEPRVVERLKGIHITKIAAGGWHSAALSQSGDLYTWGWNVDGQLGFYNENVDRYRQNRPLNSVGLLNYPQVVDINDNIDLCVKEIACGMRHTVVFTKEGRLFGTGSNKYFQLGKTIDRSEICEMKKLTHSTFDVESCIIKCGDYSTSVMENANCTIN